MTKMYLLLSLIKDGDSSYVEERMSTPLVSYILLGVISLVVLMRVISWLQILHFKHKVKKLIFEKQKNREERTRLPTLLNHELKSEYSTEEVHRLAVWIYDIQLNLFISLHNNAFSKDGMSYETGLELIHPDDREIYENDLHMLSSGLIERMTELLRFYNNGEYEVYRFNAVAIRSVSTGKVDKIIGTEEKLYKQN